MTPSVLSLSHSGYDHTPPTGVLRALSVLYTQADRPPRIHVSGTKAAHPATPPGDHPEGADRGARTATQGTAPPLLGASGADPRPPPRVVRPQDTGARRAHPVVLGGRRRPPGLAGGALRSAEGDVRGLVVPHDPAPTALSAGDDAHDGLRLLGILLATGLRPRVAVGRTDPVRLRLRHAAGLVASRQLRPGLRAVPDHLQHKPVSLVPRRLVLSAVPHAGRRVHGQSVRAVATRRPEHPHLQPLGVLARPVLTGLNRDEHDRPDLGPGHRDDADPRATHLSVPVPDRAGRHVLLLDHTGRRLSGGRTVRVERALLGGHRGPVLHRLGDPERCVPWVASAGDRPVHFAENTARQGGVRGALRAGCLRALLATRRARCADLLRQAFVCAAPELERAADRPSGPAPSRTAPSSPGGARTGHRRTRTWST